MVDVVVHGRRVYAHLKAQMLRKSPVTLRMLVGCWCLTCRAQQAVSRWIISPATRRWMNVMEKGRVWWWVADGGEGTKRSSLGFLSHFEGHKGERRYHRALGAGTRGESRLPNGQNETVVAGYASRIIEWLDFAQALRRHYPLGRGSTVSN